jgi:hypothetical protein
MLNIVMAPTLPVRPKKRSENQRGDNIAAVFLECPSAKGK